MTAVTVLVEQPSAARRFFSAVRRGFARLVVDSSRRRRLEEELTIFVARVDDYARTGESATWLATLVEHIDQARAAIGESDLDRGWACLLAAQRYEVDGLPPSQVIARLEAVRKEVRSKLGDWRRDGALAILAQADPFVTMAEGAQLTGDAVVFAFALGAIRGKLKEALLIRDENSSNVYRKIQVRRDRLVLTGAILMAVLFVMYALSPDAAIASDNSSSVLDRAQLVMVILLGMLGGLVSTALSLADDKIAGKRIPDHVASFYMTLARPVFGASFAVAVAVAMRSGVITLFGGKEGAIAFAAFLAGYSERWFLGVVGKASGETKTS
jgi:hypothetical protein